MAGPQPDITGIDLSRVYFLYSLKGALAKDVAFSMNITVQQVRACLSAYARENRDRVKKLQPWRRPPAQVKPKKPRPVAKPKPERIVERGRNRNSFEKHCAKSHEGFDLERSPSGLYLSERTRGAWDFYTAMARILLRPPKKTKKP